MIKIRYAEFEDVENIIDVNLKTWRTTYGGIVDEDFLLKLEVGRNDSVKRAKDNFGKRKIEGRKIYDCVATHGENFIGMLTYGKCREEDKLGLSNCGEVYAIYILKEYQQKGIGKRLINFAIEDLANENYEKLIIWALKENPSVEFYKKIGGEIGFKKDIKIGEQLLEEIGFIFDIDKISI